MGKCIRQRFLMIAGSLLVVEGSLYRSFKRIGLAERSIKRQREGLRDYLGLHKGEKDTRMPKKQKRIILIGQGLPQ